MLPILACSLASFAFAFLRFSEPFTLRDKPRESRCKRHSKALCAFGPVTISPVESVANDDTPKSTPTTPAAEDDAPSDDPLFILIGRQRQDQYCRQRSLTG